MVGFFARSIMRDLRLVGGFDVLFGKIKEVIDTKLFDKPGDLEDLNVLQEDWDAHRPKNFGQLSEAFN